MFTMSAPFEKPKFAVAVVVEHGGGGSKTAAPIARDILLHALHGGMPPLSAYPSEDQQFIKKQQSTISKLLPVLNVNDKLEI